ncbi:MAG: tRNA epoxyqueuosine(34) reductase QueG [Acidimicrobiia bacterium]
MDQLWETLQLVAAEHGLVGLGVGNAEPFLEVGDEMRRRKDEGLSGRLKFTYTDPGVATDVRASYPWAERLVVGASTYLPAAGDPGPPRPGTGRVARFATEDHYQELRAGMDAVAETLVAGGGRAEVLIDDNRLVDRAAAVRSGVGWWGKNTMVLAPKYGPWLLLGTAVTDVELETTPAMARDCGNCTACVPACPTGALDQPGVLDATRCISYWAQMPGIIPQELRIPWGDRVYGCDDCLEACPPGRRWMEEAISEAPGRVNLAELLTATDQELLDSYGHFYIPRRNPAFLRRNALVALGNSGGPEAVALAVRYMQDRDPVLRAHAAWALGRLGGKNAHRALAMALPAEANTDVRDEIENATLTLQA